MGTIGTIASRAALKSLQSPTTPKISQGMRRDTTSSVAVSDMSALSLESQVTNIVECSVKSQFEAFENKISSLFARMEQSERVPTGRVRPPAEVDTTAVQDEDSGDDLQ